MARLALFIAVVAVCGACGTTSVFEIEEGDCFDDVTDFSEVSRLPVVDCDEPHDNEVYAVVDYLVTTAYPGVDTLRDFAEEECLPRFEEFIGFDYFESELDFSAFWPSEESWETGDREVICFAYELDFSKITGTLEGAAR